MPLSSHRDVRSSYDNVWLITAIPGEPNFWVVDAALSYRLPKRYGFITVGATNLFDKHFRYQETDLSLVAGNQETMPLEPISLTRNALIQPARTFFAILTLAFP
jgi:hypothetical protein